MSNATGGGVGCIGHRQVGYRLEKDISTESLTGANIEVRHAKNESSMIMDRCGTQTSVILHKFAKVLLVEIASRQNGQRHEDCGCQHETRYHRGDWI